MSRRTAHDVLKIAFEEAGLNGHLATHSLRKSFAQRLYDRTGDIFAVQEMLGHQSVTTTQKYLGVNYASVREDVEEMSLESELQNGIFGSATLFLELALRGYDLSSLRDEETTIMGAFAFVELAFGDGILIPLFSWLWNYLQTFL